MTILETAQLIGSFGAIVTGFVAIFVAIFGKKARTPSDDQARVEFGVKVLENRVTELNADRVALQGTEKFLREQLSKADERDTLDFKEKQELRALIEDLNKIIREKDKKIREYHNRLDRLATKLTSGQTITLADIYGEQETSDLGDLEHTVTEIPAS